MRERPESLILTSQSLILPIFTSRIPSLKVLHKTVNYISLTMIHGCAGPQGTSRLACCGGYHCFERSAQLGGTLQTKWGSHCSKSKSVSNICSYKWIVDPDEGPRAFPCIFQYIPLTIVSNRKMPPDMIFLVFPHAQHHITSPILPSIATTTLSNDCPSEYRWTVAGQSSRIYIYDLVFFEHVNNITTIALWCFFRCV